jgi:cytochrome P450
VPSVKPDEIDLMDPAVQENWFATYRILRDQAPVWQVPATGEYFLSRYEDVTYVLRHPELFPHTSTSSGFSLLKTEAANRYYVEHGWRRKQTLGIDPPVHREYRVLVDPWFNGAGAERHRGTIERLASSLIEQWLGDGQVEIVNQFAMPLPVMVITSVLGFPLDDIQHLKRWSEAWVWPFSRNLTPEQEMHVAEQGVAFQRYIWDHLEQKRRDPQDDFLSHLAQAKFKDPEQGERLLTDAEIVNLIDHLYTGGNETTTFAITSGLWLLVNNPDIERRLRADRALIPTFVDEVLRLESPTQGLWRGVARDVELGGVPIPTGATVHIRYGAANRDPDMFAEPDTLDPERRNAGRHVAFGAGEHRCPGEGLSKLEQRIAVELFLRRMSNLRFTPEQNDFTHMPGFWLRALKSLHVSFDPVPLS